MMDVGLALGGQSVTVACRNEDEHCCGKQPDTCRHTLPHPETLADERSADEGDNSRHPEHNIFHQLAIPDAVFAEV